MSVDETDSPTTLAEHVYIASELRGLNVKWVSLAPRYVGSVEKGVDYIGDLAEFERSFAGHSVLNAARFRDPFFRHCGGTQKNALYLLKCISTGTCRCWRKLTESAGGGPDHGHWKRKPE